MLPFWGLLKAVQCGSEGAVENLVKHQQGGPGFLRPIDLTPGFLKPSSWPGLCRVPQRLPRACLLLPMETEEF